MVKKKKKMVKKKKKKRWNACRSGRRRRETSGGKEAEKIGEVLERTTRTFGGPASRKTGSSFIHLDTDPLGL